MGDVVSLIRDDDNPRKGRVSVRVHDEVTDAFEVLSHELDSKPAHLYRRALEEFLRKHGVTDVEV